MNGEYYAIAMLVCFIIAAFGWYMSQREVLKKIKNLTDFRSAIAASDDEDLPPVEFTPQQRWHDYASTALQGLLINPNYVQDRTVLSQTASELADRMMEAENSRFD